MAALKFSERRQGESEGFESIVTDLKILFKDCDYQEEERIVSDAIFFRCKYTKVCEKCLDLAKELTLEKAAEIGRNHEKNLNSLKKLSKGEPNSECHRKEETSKTNASTNLKVKRRNLRLASLKINVVDVVMIRPTRNVQQWDNSAGSVRR